VGSVEFHKYKSVRHTEFCKSQASFKCEKGQTRSESNPVRTTSERPGDGPGLDVREDVPVPPLLLARAGTGGCSGVTTRYTGAKKATASTPAKRAKSVPAPAEVTPPTLSQVLERLESLGREATRTQNAS